VEVYYFMNMHTSHQKDAEIPHSYFSANLFKSLHNAMSNNLNEMENRTRSGIYSCHSIKLYQH
jgi:hypothetical protein